MIFQERLSFKELAEVRRRNCLSLTRMTTRRLLQQQNLCRLPGKDLPNFSPYPVECLQNIDGRSECDVAGRAVQNQPTSSQINSTKKKC
jgi:hypothetical protein